MTPSRRRFLVAAAGSLALGAGCLESGQSTADGTPTDTGRQTPTDRQAESTPTDPAVTVTRTRTSTWSPRSWERTLTVSTAEGRVTETLDCGETTAIDSASLSDSELEPFRELAGDDAVGALEPTYSCADSCPTDVPPTTVTISTPADDRTVTVDAGAEPPALLARVMAALEAASEQVSTGACAPPEPTTETG
ncbi:hypothetical protein NDI56_14550 [Haloarcula sp. S1CR25-12]|uniref:Twin-arginine translocation signal domain-containing protein n=1 Tax=Haloarcula saliterrae TaxID=2950534 RepID=A0ABU2FED3_9EURY|nr:hypothetical protein [Haloarcula sp. S1CR25-12]MDS0260623.1 hypothetical protein [Haloarcula sp. S1CR25-12]